MENEFRRVVIDVPVFGKRRNRVERFRIVVDQSLIQRHVDSGFRLAGADRRIERFGFVTIYITQNVALGRNGVPIEFAAGRNYATGDRAKQKRSDRNSRDYL